MATIEEKIFLKQLAIEWALSHGLVLRNTSNAGMIPAPFDLTSSVHVPFSLFPTKFPATLYEQACLVQPHFNTLVHKVSQDKAFLTSIVESLRIDNFTSRLFKIYQEVEQKQPVTMGILRSDYLIHGSMEYPKLIQVELNTIAASFGCLSPLTSMLHRYLAKYSATYRVSAGDPTEESLPYVDTAALLAKGIATAHKLFGEGVVVMVVQPNERNVFDQRHLEFKLMENHGIKLVRQTLLELSNAKLVDDELIIPGPNGPMKCSVVYFRAGYTPNDYPTEAEWNARIMIEKSTAIKCPTIAQQLAGTKKVQQVLCSETELSKFLTGEPMSLVKRTFTNLYPLDESAAGLKAFETVMNHPENFVLKPQREGGGNNVYGKNIPRVLSHLSLDERKSYILMDRIKSPVTKNVMLRNGELTEAEVISELGIFGVYVAKNNEILENYQAGHLLRTKSSTCDEGGVASGFAVLDSVMLIK